MSDVTLLSLGLDFRQADLSLRERFHRGDEETTLAYERLAGSGLDELVLVDTCNRVEAYAVARNVTGAEAARRLAYVCGGYDAASDLLEAGALRLDADAVRHALRVASGLESQVLGDIHILGQLRRSYRRAIGAEAVGPVLHRLFDLALQTGKQVKRETELMAGHASVGREAVRLASDQLGDLSSLECVVIGCGKTGSHAARALVDAGVRSLVVLNRTEVRAQRLAAEVGASTASLDELHARVAGAQLAIVATGASQPILRSAGLERARRIAGASGPLLIVDVSMPRNVERGVAELPGTQLVDLDALNPGAAKVEKARLASVEQAEAVIASGLEEFDAWKAGRADQAATAPMRECLEEICRRELGYIADEEVVQKITTRIVAKFMAAPMTSLRDAGQAGHETAALHEALQRLFAASPLANGSAVAHQGG